MKKFLITIVGTDGVAAIRFRGKVDAKKATDILVNLMESDYEPFKIRKSLKRTDELKQL